MELIDFQKAADETNQLKSEGPKSLIAPLLGLASETGSILNVYKKYLRDGLDLAAQRQFLKEELGDLLWYVAAVATASNLDLEEIAQANLRKTHDRYQPRSSGIALEINKLPNLDEQFPITERFPRNLTVEFSQQQQDGQLVAHLTLIDANPNPFSNGPLIVDSKKIGFTIGKPFGDPLTDNSRRMDDYRFHDAIHMGFMAVLGWSPTLRALLRLKRKSNPMVDECEDGARAIFAEEGMAAVLSRLAERRTNFQTETSVDGEAIVVVKAATAGLEVEQLPAWLWRKAINQGFMAMQQLGENEGGFLIANLDERKLTYRKML
jgi:NTP pyrophosphatase (non-canonical NTP hydrolase)